MASSSATAMAAALSSSSLRGVRAPAFSLRPAPAVSVVAYNKQLVQQGRGMMLRAAYTVKLVTPQNKEELISFEVDGSTYILDAAEEAGVELPYSCRAGACSACAGVVVQGTVDQPDTIFLNDEMAGKGYTLTCVAYATSDLVIEASKGGELYN